MEHEQTYFGPLFKVSTADPVGLALQNHFLSPGLIPVIITLPPAFLSFWHLNTFWLIKAFVLFKCFPHSLLLSRKALYKSIK